MKRFFFYPLLLLIMGCSVTSQQESRNPLTVMSFNVRMATDDDGSNSWRNRVQNVEAFLSTHEPDLLGAQEVLYQQLIDLEAMLPSYQYIGVGREDGDKGGEYAPIFYNTEKLKLIDSGYFWLSQQPNEPSFGWDAACERIATWAYFERLSDGKPFALLNTHFDHVGEQARANSSQMIKEWANQWPDSVPVVVTGDFNATPTSTVVTSLMEELKDSFQEANSNEGASWSFHDFGSIPEIERNRIDYIFFKGDLEPTKYICFDQPESIEENLWLSDHTPILVQFLL